jgi:hypothetical protein
MGVGIVIFHDPLLGLPFSSTFPVLFGKLAEFDPARLVGV